MTASLRWDGASVRGLERQKQERITEDTGRKRESTEVFEWKGRPIGTLISDALH